MAERLDIDEAAIAALMLSPAGPVGRLLIGVTQRTAANAKRRAPVGQPSKTPEGHPAGYLRSQIDWRIGVDFQGQYGDIASPALTSRANPFPGEPYGLHLEDPSTRPRKAPSFVPDDGRHLVPALEDEIRRLG